MLSPFLNLIPLINLLTLIISFPCLWISRISSACSPHAIVKFSLIIDYNNNQKIFLEEILVLMLIPGLDMLRVFIIRVSRGKNPFVKKYKKKLIWPIHPRTKKNIVKFNIKIEKKFIKLVDPLGFFDFTNLEKNSLCTLTDSGTVQEECAIFKVPGIILRENTERPETIESGSSIINDNIFNILQNIEFSINTKNESEIPDGYNKKNVSTKVVKIITSKILV